MRLFSVCGLPVTREHGSFHSLVSCREKAHNLSHGEKKGTEEVWRYKADKLFIRHSIQCFAMETGGPLHAICSTAKNLNESYCWIIAVCVTEAASKSFIQWAELSGSG